MPNLIIQFVVLLFIIWATIGDILHQKYRNAIADKPMLRAASYLNSTANGEEKEEKEEEIEHGQISPGSDWPWAVSVRVVGVTNQSSKEEILGTCSGVLVEEKWLLTAAHCFFVVANNLLRCKGVEINGAVPEEGSHFVVFYSSVKVTVGGVDWSTGHALSIHKFFKHETFKKASDFDNDIALVQIVDTIHLEIMARHGVLGGNIRAVDVRVVDEHGNLIYTPPPAAHVPQLLEQFIQDVNSAIGQASTGLMEARVVAAWAHYQLFVVLLFIIWATIGDILHQKYRNAIADKPMLRAASYLNCTANGEEKEEEIEHGQISPGSDWPWAVSVRVVGVTNQSSKEEILGTCSGVLVEEKWLLTAAHCFFVVANNLLRCKGVEINGAVPEEGSHFVVFYSSVKVTVGGVDWSTGHALSIHKFFKHETFKKASDFDNDIALVQIVDTIHLEIMARHGVLGGNIRAVDVRVVDEHGNLIYTPPPAAHVPQLLEQFIQDVNSAIGQASTGLMEARVVAAWAHYQLFVVLLFIIWATIGDILHQKYRNAIADKPMLRAASYLNSTANGEEKEEEEEEVMNEDFGREIQCGVNKHLFHSRIEHGQISPGSDWPWAVSVRVVGVTNQSSKEEILGTCSGVLVEEKWLLTAAHCFFVVANNLLRCKGVEINGAVPEEGSHFVVFYSSVKVTVGGVDWSTGHALSIHKFFKHETFKKASDFDNDIALVQRILDLSPAVVRKYEEVEEGCSSGNAFTR
ncbi:hypothetical protein niasHS_004968 [Heterodera schachtii]|uniref:Peptidase S1 domain-containing protein n=1 Tax=Heterodera schachtii TaxID=97005 RepID=A0ABD2JQN6_HETSC